MSGETINSIYAIANSKYNGIHINAVIVQNGWSDEIIVFKPDYVIQAY